MFVFFTRAGCVISPPPLPRSLFLTWGDGYGQTDPDDHHAVKPAIKCVDRYTLFQCLLPQLRITGQVLVFPVQKPGFWLL